MRVHVTTDLPLTKKDFTSYQTLTGDEVTIAKTTEPLRAKWNPFFNAWWGDFDYIRAITPKGYEVRAYVTSKKRLRAAGIKHLGLYDLVDKDGVIDFYIGIPDEHTKRAMDNGFVNNLTWLMVHERLHGCEQNAGVKDRVHSMEEQGRLKELLKMHGTQSLTVKLIDVLKEAVSAYVQLLWKRRKLLPAVQRGVDAVIKDMEMLGLPVRVVEGYRTMERQAELYAQGRTTPGSIVTNAQPGQSFHNYGVAADIIFKRDGYHAPLTHWNTLGVVAKKHGFVWGGDWDFADYPHIEMTFGHSWKDFRDGKVDYTLYK